MSKSKLPNSLRKYIRKEKSRIRRAATNTGEADVKIRSLVEKTMAQCKKMTYGKKS